MIDMHVKNILNKGKNAANADFTGANLSHRTFIGVDFSQSNFEKANLEQAVFLDCIFNGSKFNDANLQKAHANNCFFRNVGLRNVVAIESIFTNCSFVSSDFSNSDFSASCLININMSDFDDCQNKFVNTNFDGAVITNTVFNTIEEKAIEDSDDDAPMMII